MCLGCHETCGTCDGNGANKCLSCKNDVGRKLVKETG